ncbi:MAG: flagellin [Proteobacteria bacterium]|nr:flagellin [Pseudomonadota bacterium]
MAVVNTNVNASIAQNALMRNERSMNTAMERLSTGQRINSAADDAAGLAISSQIRGLEVGIRNANDAISMISTADGALVEVTNMLQRMRELALQASNGTTTSADRNYLSSEYTNLISEIERIAQNTQWNGSDILDGTANGTSGTVAFQVGANGGQTVSVNFGNLGSATVASVSGMMDIVHSAAANLVAGTTASAITRGGSAVTAIDSAITAVNSQRATFGAAMNQLTYAVDNLSNVKVNSEAARSRVLDTDYAKETSELARTQIIQQAGTAMLAQANQLPQTVLSLLQ